MSDKEEMKQFYNTVTKEIDHAEHLTRYECDYCGGFDVPAEPDWSFNIKGLTLTADAIAHQPSVDLKICVWCAKKMFDRIHLLMKEDP